MPSCCYTTAINARLKLIGDVRFVLVRIQISYKKAHNPIKGQHVQGVKIRLMATRFTRLIRLFLALAVLAIVVFALAALPRGPRPTQVSTTRAIRQNLSSFITSNGKVEPVE